MESHADEQSGDYSDDDDARSIAILAFHELERVDEEAEQIAAGEEEERRRRSNEIRPQTLEPTGIGIDDDEHNAEESRQRTI